MKYNLYSVQDTMVGFGKPFLFDRDELAIREYETTCKTHPYAKDLRLFKIGKFDSESGEVVPEIPKCIGGGLDGTEI